MFWAAWHQSMSTYSQQSFFQFHLKERLGMSGAHVDVQTKHDISRTVDDRG